MDRNEKLRATVTLTDRIKFKFLKVIASFLWADEQCLSMIAQYICIDMDKKERDNNLPEI